MKVNEIKMNENNPTTHFYNMANKEIFNSNGISVQFTNMYSRFSNENKKNYCYNIGALFVVKTYKFAGNNCQPSVVPTRKKVVRVLYPDKIATETVELHKMLS